LLLVAINVWLLIIARPGRRGGAGPRRRVVAVLYIPTCPVCPTIRRRVVSIQPSCRADHHTNFLLFGASFPRSVDFIPIIALMIVLVIAALDMLRKAPCRVRPYWLLCAMTILVVLLSVMGISLLRSSIYLDRSFGLLSPFLIAAVAGGVAYARRPRPCPADRTAGRPDERRHYEPCPCAGRASRHSDDRNRPHGDARCDICPDTILAIIPFDDYYAPTLTKLARYRCRDRSWLWPQGAVFPQTWHTFGIDRLSRDQIAAWLSDYHGPLRVFVSATLEPPEQATLRKLLQSPCSREMTSYGPFVSVFRFNCP
jgi:uncharacterized membrane protein